MHFVQEMIILVDLNHGKLRWIDKRSLSLPICKLFTQTAFLVFSAYSYSKECSACLYL